MKKMKDDEERKIQMTMTSLIYSIKLLLDTGDVKDLTGNQTKNLDIVPLVKVPYHRLDMSGILQSLSTFVFSDEAQNLGIDLDPRVDQRFAVIKASLSRQAMKMISASLARPALAATFGPFLDALANNARIPCPTTKASLLSMEDRSRALELLDTTELKDQLSVAQAELKQALKTSNQSSGSKLKLNKNFTLNWNPNTSVQNVTFVNDNREAQYNRNSTHRSIIAEQGFDSGVHEWSVEITKKPCCAYAGIASSASTCGRAYSAHFVDKDTCVGFSNFSGDRNFTYNVGTICKIKLDFDEGTITYSNNPNKSGPRTVRIIPPKNNLNVVLAQE